MCLLMQLKTSTGSEGGSLFAAPIEVGRPSACAPASAGDVWHVCMQYSSRHCLQGYLFGLLSAMLSALAAVYTEWVMKRNNDSLYWQVQH